MTASGPAVNSKLVLQRDHADIGDVQKVRRALVRGEVLLLDFKPHLQRIIVLFFMIGDGHDKEAPGSKHQTPKSVPRCCPGVGSLCFSGVWCLELFTALFVW